MPEIESRLIGQVEKWRDKLLDLGNRNPLINCSFNPSRGVIELLFQDCELIWRKLAADGAAGSDPMRFPWRRDLVPPLSDDLNHHLGALSAAFLRVSEAADPLVSEGLLPEEPSPGTLNETVRALKDALTAPHVPASWFAAPEEVASTVLRRCEADDEVQQFRMVLCDYLDDVEVRMPDEWSAGSRPRRVRSRDYSQNHPGDSSQRHAMIDANAGRRDWLHQVDGAARLAGQRSAAASH